MMNIQDTLLTLMFTQIHHFITLVTDYNSDASCSLNHQSHNASLKGPLQYNNKPSLKDYLTTESVHYHHTTKRSSQPTHSNAIPKPLMPTKNSKPASTHCTKHNTELDNQCIMIGEFPPTEVDDKKPPSPDPIERLHI